ncbi:hypothetical protein D0C36_01770 [Mucilaginibacter conchicola]|uniref:Uncharacterized protein n=1 Tax=Mucilaginibacter conchicola TaxID=2303333 RepID=A0A372NW05_9SPHI|nr:hypothetical protein D0C36_01770 [Mucilaginibacter conchicola]
MKFLLRTSDLREFNFIIDEIVTTYGLQSEKSVDYHVLDKELTEIFISLNFLFSIQSKGIQIIPLIMRFHQGDHVFRQ